MFFEKLDSVPADPIFGLVSAFNNDPRKEKVNLAIGIYDNELFPSVRKAQDRLQELKADYLPISGLKEMIEALVPIVFGKAIPLFGAHTAG